jgi:nucleoside-diphosphate-sugar epimerase
MKQAFVTGGTGFLGLNLVEQLTQAGWRVTALHRPSSNLTYLGKFPITLAEGSILDRESLERTMPKGADAVFHMAANTSIWSRNNATQTRDNVEGTRNVVDAALAAGAKRFIYTSTWNVFGQGHETISEDTPQTGANSWINYVRTKAAAEEIVREALPRGLKAVILNPAHIIGRYDTGNWARMIIMVERNALPGVPPGAGAFCHAEQVAKAHIAAAKLGRIGENYLLGGREASFLDVVATIGELLDRKVPNRAMPAWLLRLVARVYELKAAITGREPEVTPEGAALVLFHPRILSDKAERELGYHPVPLEGMLRDSIQWLRAEGLLNGN